MSDEEAPEEAVAEETQVDAPEASAPAEGVDAAESAAEQPEVWSHFRNMEQFQGQDDQQIAQSLYEAMQREQHATQALQQYQSTIPIVQEYLNNRNTYEEWKTGQNQPQQQVPQQPQQQEEPSWWNPPTVKDSHRRWLGRDENGREVIDQNAPLDARAALEDYMTYRADFAQKFLDNPEEALGGMVEKIATQKAEAMIDQRMGRMQDETYVSNLEAENKDWLYDSQGNVSPEGLAVQKYISDAKSAGVQGAQARWDYATKMVERDLLLRTIQGMQQPQQQAQPQQQPVQQAAQQQPSVEQQNMNYLRNQAMRTASQRSAATTNARVPEKSMTFHERLLSAAQEQGMY